jgi:kynurenine formamidase
MPEESVPTGWMDTQMQVHAEALTAGVNRADARLWHPWLRINRVLRVMLHTRWNAEAWSVVRVEFRRALAVRSEIRRAGWFIHENASGVKAVLSDCASAAASVNHPFAHVHA